MPACHGIQHRTTGRTAEAEQHFGGQALKQNPELLGGAACIRPGDAEPRPEPGERRADQSRRDEISPPSESAIGHRFVAPATAVHQPLAGPRKPVALQVRDRLDDRTHGAPPPPQLDWWARSRRPVAQLDADDRYVLEHLAGRMIRYRLAVADLVATGAAGGVAPSAPCPGLSRQIANIILIAIDRGDVDGECRRQYTDRSACAAASLTTVRDRTSPLRV